MIDLKSLEPALEPDGLSRTERLLVMVIKLLIEIRDLLRAGVGRASGDDDELLTVEEAASALRRHKSEMWKLMEPGEHQLRFVQRDLSARRFIRRSEIRRWIRQHEIGGSSCA